MERKIELDDIEPEFYRIDYPDGTSEYRFRAINIWNDEVIDEQYCDSFRVMSNYVINFMENFSITQ